MRAAGRTGRRTSPTTTRAPPASRRRSGSRPAISANGPTTIVASVASMPSGLVCRVGNIAPALSMTDVEPRLRRDDSLDGAVDRCQRRHVGDDGRKAVLRRASRTSSSRTAAELRRRRARARTTRAPEAGELIRRPRVRARMSRRSAGPSARQESRRLARVQPNSAAANVVADAREAADHGDLEEVVDDGRWVASDSASVFNPLSNVVANHMSVV